MDILIFIISTTLMYSTPLIFTGLGGVLSERSGVINIGLEGSMTIGAFVAAWITLETHNPWLGLLSAGVGGLLLSFLHAYASIKYKANQVVSGMALNFIGAGSAVYLCRLIYEGASTTKPIDLDWKLPLMFGLNLTVYLAFFCAFIIWYLLNKTTLGLRLRASGENPKALLSAGIDVKKYKYIGVLSSGFLAGVGGASLSIEIVSNFRPTLISGQGFIAIAAMIFGKWNPIGTLFACLFFGLSQSFVIFLSGIDSIGVSSQLLNTLPYVLTIFILIGFIGKTASPKALGQ